VLSVPVQVIAWNDLSPKWPIMCQAGCKTLLAHSLTHSLYMVLLKMNIADVIQLIRYAC